MNAEPDTRSQSVAIADGQVPAWLAAIIILLLLLVLVLAGLLVWAKSDQGRVRYLAAGSLSMIEQRVRRTNSPSGYVELGFEYRKAGRPDQAVEAFDRALSIDPKYTPALYHKGAALAELGQRREAEKLFRDALAVDPTHALSAKALGDIYASREEYQELLKIVEPAATASPALADLQFLFGTACEMTGDREGAMEAYTRAFESDRGLIEAKDALERLEAVQQ